MTTSPAPRSAARTAPRRYPGFPIVSDADTPPRGEYMNAISNAAGSRRYVNTVHRRFAARRAPRRHVGLRRGAEPGRRPGEAFTSKFSVGPIEGRRAAQWITSRRDKGERVVSGGWAQAETQSAENSGAHMDDESKRRRSKSWSARGCRRGSCDSAPSTASPTDIDGAHGTDIRLLGAEKAGAPGGESSRVPAIRCRPVRAARDRHAQRQGLDLDVLDGAALSACRR